MAAATKLLAKSQGCVAVLNYDDVTLLSTGVTIANVSGVETIVFFVVVAGVTLSRTILKGQSAVIVFASSILCTTGISSFNGGPSFIPAGFGSFGIGSG